MAAGQVSLLVSKELWHSYVLRLSNTCEEQSCLWSFFLVYVVEENTSLGVGMDGFFCKVRGYTASLVFIRSVAVVVCDATFRSNH